MNNYVVCLLLNRGKEAIMVANINLIKQESYSVVNLEKQLSRTVTNKIITMSKSRPVGGSTDRSVMKD